MRKFLIFLLILPFSFFVVSHLIPLAFGVGGISTFDKGGNFIGLGNYQTAIGDKIFWGSISFTLLYAIAYTVICLFAGLFIGTFLNQIKRGQGFFIAILLIPYAISFTIWGLELKIMFNREFGVINHMLMSTGIVGTQIQWLADPVMAKIAIISSSIFRDVWLPSLLFFVACKTIPRSLYDSAMICGAKTLQTFRFITFPLLKGTMIFVGILLFIQSLQAFDIIYALTYGGPGYSTFTAPLYIFRQGMGLGNFEYATALATIWTLMVFGLIAVIFLTIGRKMLKVES